MVCVPRASLDNLFGAMATLRKNLAQWEQELAGAKKRLDDLTSPKRPEEKTPTGKPTEDMQRIACVVSGGQWVNGKCEKKATGGTEKDTTGAQLAVVKAQAESEFKVLKEGLDLQKATLDRSLDDRLVSVRDYYARKTQIEQQAIDQELAAKQQELNAQSSAAVGGSLRIPRSSMISRGTVLSSVKTSLRVPSSVASVSSSSSRCASRYSTRWPC